MDIAHLDPPAAGHQGDHHYRTLQPCRALGEQPGLRLMSGCWLSPAMRTACTEADILILNKTVDFDLLPLVAARKAAGLRTVYEINDDFAALEDEHPTRAFFASVSNRSLLTQLARMADGLQFSSGGLQKAYGHLNPHQRVFANHVYDPPPRRSYDETNGRVTLGWAGSAGHLEDVRRLLPTLEQLFDACPQLDLAIMGSERIRALFKPFPASRCRLRGTGTLDEYLEFVRGLDIGLAPLRPTPFNEGRSDIKFVEYAAHGVVAVCAAVGPYLGSVDQGNTGFLVDNERDWLDVLQALVTDGAMRVRVSSQAQVWALEKRLEQSHAGARLAFYAESWRPPEDGGRRARFGKVFADHAAPWPNSQYRPIPLGSAEKHLYNGLLTQSDARKAEQDYAQAAKLGADNYLIHLYAGAGAADFEPLLKQAQKLAPTSPAVAFTLAQRLLANSRLSDAQEALNTTLAVAPSHAPARTMLSAIQDTRGEAAAAEQGYRRALSDNPDYYPAALSLAQRLSATQRASEALQVLHSVCGSAKEDAGYWLQLAKLQLGLGQRSEALASLEQNQVLDPEGPAAQLLARFKQRHSPQD